MTAVGLAAAQNYNTLILNPYNQDLGFLYTMELAKRITLLIFGFLSGLLGILSIIVSIIMMTVSVSDIKDPAGRIYMMVCKFIIGELLLAFGIAASLLGLRCVCGPRKWIVTTINFMWKRAVSIALIYGYLMIATIVVLLLIKLFSSLL